MRSGVSLSHTIFLFLWHCGIWWSALMIGFSNIKAKWTSVRNNVLLFIDAVSPLFSPLCLGICVSGICVRVRVSSFCRCEKCLCALAAASVAYWWSGRRVTHSCNTHMQHAASPWKHLAWPRHRDIHRMCVCERGLSFPLCEVVFSAGDALTVNWVWS